MMNIYVEIGLACVTGFSTILALYVTVRLSKFKEELVKRLDGTYVKVEVFGPWQRRVDQDVDLAFRKLDKNEDELKQVEIKIARMR